MDFKNIQELIKTVNESELTSFEIENDGISIKMKKGGFNTDIKPIDKTVDEIINVKAQKTELSRREAQVNKNIEIVKSPIVGMFYSSPSPKDDDYVKIGSQVKKGQTLCIIEAMKLMNEIEAECDGKIVEILAEKEQMVEYGQDLFKIDKTS